MNHWLRLLPIVCFLYSGVAHSFFDQEAWQKRIDGQQQDIMVLVHRVDHLQALFDHEQLRVLHRMQLRDSFESTVRGELSEMRHRLDVLLHQQEDYGHQLTELTAYVKSSLPERAPQKRVELSPEAPDVVAYDMILTLLKQEKNVRANARLLHWIKLYPHSALMADARYWLAMTEFLQQHYEVARDQLNHFLSHYSQSDKVPMAWLGLANCYVALHDQKRAHAAINTLFKRYPHSSAALEAKKQGFAIVK